MMQVSPLLLTILVTAVFIFGALLSGRLASIWAALLSRLHGAAFVPQADSWVSYDTVKVTISPHADVVYVIPYKGIFPLKGIIVTDLGAQVMAQFLNTAVAMIEERNQTSEAPAFKQVNP